MKYELTTQPHSILTDAFIVSNENTLNDNEYSATITMFIHSVDGVSPTFSKDIEVISTNAMTGFEVDAQRNKAVNDYISEINK